MLARPARSLRGASHASTRALSSPPAAPHVAMILSGSGYLDGAEVTESVAAIVGLARAGARVSFYAPDADQMHVVDHNTGEVAPGETRSVIAESARITRGGVAPLGALDVEAHEALVVPGGFGAAKNLSTFAVDGPDLTVNAEVERVVRGFHEAGKPIGMCCIAPVLAAAVLGDKASVTVGGEDEEGGRWPYAGTAAAVRALGAEHVPKELAEAHTAGNLVTSPAYMANAPPHEVFDSVQAMVGGVMDLLAAARR